MSKVTSKLQVAIPKALAQRYGIHPGDEVAVEPAGEALRLIPSRGRSPRLSTEECLRLFDEATARQRARETVKGVGPEVERGWKREDLYVRGRAD